MSTKKSNRVLALEEEVQTLAELNNNQANTIGDY